MKKTKMIAGFFAALLLFSVTSVSCSKKSGARAYDAVMNEKAVMSSEMCYDSEAYDDAKALDSNVEVERKLIKTGTIRLKVESLSETDRSIKNWCTSLGGYIESSDLGNRGGSATVRIPSNRFELAMDSAGDFGKVESKNVSTEDVTEAFYDLESRIETKKIMRDRLQKYLGDAANVGEMLQIEKELNDVISDIESMESRMKHLSGQIDYSKIFIYYDLPYRVEENIAFKLPDIANGFRHFVSNVLDFLFGLIQFILYLVVYGIPIIALVAFFYWFLFGKLGLLKKIFRKLRGNKE